MESLAVLNDFPFTFSHEATIQVILTLLAYMLFDTFFSSSKQSLTVFPYLFNIIDAFVISTGLCKSRNSVFIFEQERPSSSGNVDV